LPRYLRQAESKDLHLLFDEEWLARQRNVRADFRQNLRIQLWHCAGNAVDHAARPVHAKQPAIMATLDTKIRTTFASHFMI
jgi:hypothetical protein